MQTPIWIQLALVLLAGHVSAQKLRTPIDHISRKDREPDVQRQAKVVCEEKDSKNYAIQRPSTALAVINYVAESIPECWTQYGDSMAQLKEILTTGEDDYCGDAKLSLVEDFHHKYVSRIKRDVKNRKANDLKIPAILELFFTFYARHLASDCKWHTQRSQQLLERAGTPVEQDSDPDKETFERMLQEFDSNFSQEFSSHNHKDVFLFWNVVDSLSYDASGRNKFAKYVKTGDELTSKDDHRVAIKMQDGKNLVAAQNYCRKYLRPVYSRSILPVIRLTDMGYMAEALDFISIDRRWYSVTQFCETILPIRVVEDSSLVDGRLILLTKEEAAQIACETPVQVKHPADSVELNHNLKQDNAISGSYMNYEDPKLNSELNSRSAVVKRFLVKLAPRIKESDKSTKSGVSFSRGSAGEEDISQTISQELVDLKKPTLMERTKAAFHRALRASVRAFPYVLIILASPLLLVAGALKLIVKGFIKWHKNATGTN